MVPAPLPVIVNRSGGTASREGDALRDKLQSAFKDAGQSIILELVEGKDIDAALDRHRAAPRIAVGGGDGTLGNAAGKLAQWDTEFAVLPLGTRNHFARQLDIPLDLEGAARVAAHGAIEAVDISQAGERTFLNNASLGAYVDLVEAREDSGLPKAVGSVVAGLRVLRKLRARRYDLTLDGRAAPTRTVQLFIGNNRYEVSQGQPGERPSLRDGVLSVFATAPLSRLGLLRTAFPRGARQARHEAGLRARRDRARGGDRRIGRDRDRGGRRKRPAAAATDIAHHAPRAQGRDAARLSRRAQACHFSATTCLSLPRPALTCLGYDLDQRHPQKLP